MNFFKCIRIALAGTFFVISCTSDVEPDIFLLNADKSEIVYYSSENNIYYFGNSNEKGANYYLESVLARKPETFGECVFLDPFVILKKFDPEAQCNGFNVENLNNGNTLNLRCNGSYVCRGFTDGFVLAQFVFDKRGLNKMTYYPNNGAIVMKRD